MLLVACILVIAACCHLCMCLMEKHLPCSPHAPGRRENRERGGGGKEIQSNERERDCQGMKGRVRETEKERGGEKDNLHN